MTGHIFVYGFIGTRTGEVSLKNVKSQLDSGFDDYILHIISGGGDVDEGIGIYNAIKNLNKPVETHIEGLCASIATLIAAAGQKIIMNKTAEFMIHNPKISNLEGDANTLKKVATRLDQIKTLLINVYSKKTKLSQEKLWELYDKETWLTAEQAESMGFVDEAVDAIKAVARIDINNFKNEMEGNNQSTLVKWITNLFKKHKITNEVMETLEDGTQIMIMADGDDWQGKQVWTADGQPLAPGTYTLMTGESITVDENGTISKVTEATPAEAEAEKPAEPEQQNSEESENQKQEEMKKIEELEKQLAEAMAKLQASEEARTQAVTNSVSVIGKFEELNKKFEQMQDQLKKTVGDTSSPPRNPKVVNLVGDAAEYPYDPMGEEALKFLRSTNRI